MNQYTVFDSKKLWQLAQTHEATFKALGTIEKQLNERFAEMDDAILALMLAVASGESLLFVGPPGAAKSWLVRSFCHYIGIDPEQSGEVRNNHNGTMVVDYFEYLLTPFTEPGELFGYYDIAKASNEGRLERDTKGMMQHAKVVYLDEVFRGSSAILNTLLSFMNERQFHDRGTRYPVRLEVLFGATNDVPHTADLRAVYDRFLLRCEIDNIEAKATSLRNLMNKGWIETYSESKPTVFPDLLSDLKTLHAEIDRELTANKPLTDASNAFIGELAAHVNVIRQHDLSAMSNRRIIKFLRIMLIHALYQSVNNLERAKQAQNDKSVKFTDKELGLLRFMLDRRDEFAEEHLRTLY